MSDEEREGIRGDELAEEAGGVGSEAPEAPDGGVRGGEGLAEDAGDTTAPHGDEWGEDGVRGDGLADDAA
jgi:hypothetical protein